MKLPITQKCSKQSISFAYYKSLQKSDCYWQKNYVSMFLYIRISTIISL